MKSRRTHIITVLATLIVVGGFAFMPHEAHAWSFWPSTDSVIDSALAFFFNNLLMPIANMFVQLTGFLLNATMTLTLNMNALVSSTGGIVDQTWSIIRDLSSILIIFFLLFTSIEIILQRTDSKVQHLIVMVAVAGILINFSLFFTKIAVDASNLVSLAFYRAITPSGTTVSFNNGGYLSSAVNDGGLSNVFMNALELQKFYQPATLQSASGTTATSQTNTSPISVVAAGVGGTAVMIIAGLSFLASSILFIVRIGFLIILMAFSPVYFIGMIIPKFKSEISDRWWKALVGQCMIMPVYMLFMYVAMRVITNPTFKSVLDPANIAANGSSNVGLGALPSLMITPGTVGTVIQYTISIMLIMIPLFAALTFASFGKDWADAATKKVSGWGKSALAGAGRNTVGQGAYALQNKFAKSNFAANNPNAALLFNKATGAVAGASFGGSKGGFAGAQKKQQGAQDKSRKEFYERIGKVNREDYATKEEYDKARRDALGKQGQFVQSLRSNSILAHMTGGRNIGVAQNPFNVPGGANLRSANNLEKAHKKAEAKEYKDDNVKEKNENEQAIKEYKTALDRPGISDKEKANLQEQIKTLEGYNEKLEKQINEAQKAQKEDDKSAQAKATAKALKEEQESSGDPKEKSGGDKPKK